MKSHLFYLPLEPYKERYTMQWSAPKTGWLERMWIKAGVKYTRIDGQVDGAPSPIKTGCVLDAVKRSKFCFSQISQLLSLAEAGKVKNEDVIYMDDFWTPGISAIPYAFHLLDLTPRIFAFLHAQSVDEFDFTHPMRWWMRDFEIGIGKVLEGIFVCGPCLQELVVRGGIAPKSNVHVTGHPFCEEEVRERMVGLDLYAKREQKVVFSSRWDTEKRPWFFLKVADEVLKQRPDTKFVICTSSPKLRSNRTMWLHLLDTYREKYPNNVILKEGLSKEDYYKELVTAKIQMNTADQDFVAITLLEASVAGAFPIYPYFRSFPETFEYNTDYMYERQSVWHAANKVIGVLDRDDLWTKDELDSRAWIHARFNLSWYRMLRVMEGFSIEDQSPYQNYAQ
jgi:glycosyltransferase involved in cell wall biosynthesis